MLSLHLQTRHGENARKGRWAGGGHTHPQALLLPGRHRASVGGAGPVPLRFLLSTRLLDMKQEATDGFLRDTIGSYHCTERFLLLHHTLHHGRPLGSGKTVCRLLWPWPSMRGSQQEEGFPHLFHLQRADVAPVETGSQKGQGRGRKLATEDSKPVGSGESICRI